VSRDLIALLPNASPLEQRAILANCFYLTTYGDLSYDQYAALFQQCVSDSDFTDLRLRITAVQKARAETYLHAHQDLPEEGDEFRPGKTDLQCLIDILDAGTTAIHEREQQRTNPLWNIGTPCSHLPSCLLAVDQSGLAVRELYTVVEKRAEQRTVNQSIGRIIHDMRHNVKDWANRVLDELGENDASSA